MTLRKYDAGGFVPSSAIGDPIKKETTKEEQKLLDTPDIMLGTEALATKKRLLKEQKLGVVLQKEEAVTDPLQAPVRVLNPETGEIIDNRPYHEQFESGAIQSTPLVDLTAAFLAGPNAIKLAGSTLMEMYAPALTSIEGLGGVAVHDILAAMGLKHAIDSTPENIEGLSEVLQDPDAGWREKTGGLLHTGWDALMGLPAAQGLKSNVLDPFRRGFGVAQERARISKLPLHSDQRIPEPLKQLATEQGQLTLPAGINLPKPVSSEIARKLSKANVSCSQYGDCIPATDIVTNVLDANNIIYTVKQGHVSTNKTFAEGAFGKGSKAHDEIVKHTWVELEDGTVVDPTSEQFAASGGIKEYDPAWEGSPATTWTPKQYREIKTKERSANTVKPVKSPPQVGFEPNPWPYKSNNVAVHPFKEEIDQIVYQFPSFIKGSKLEKQVRLKDGTIGREALERYANSPRTIGTEAAAIKNNLQNYEGDRIPFDDFKVAMAESILPAEINVVDHLADYGVEELGYMADVPNKEGSNSWDIDTGEKDAGDLARVKTTLYKDPNLGTNTSLPTTANHFDENHTYWVRSMVTKGEPDVYHLMEMQTDIAVLKDPTKNDVLTPPHIVSRLENLGFVGFGTEGLQHDIDLVSTQIAKYRNSIESVKYPDNIYTWAKETLKELTDFKEVMKKELPTKADQKIDNAKAKGLPLKMINEALLDAARNGQSVLRVPTVETVYAIQKWRDRTNIDITAMSNRVKELQAKKKESAKMESKGYGPWITTKELEELKKLESRLAVSRDYRNFPKLWSKEFSGEVRTVTGPKGNTWYEVDVPEKFQNDLTEFKHYKKGGVVIKHNKVRVLK